MRDLLKAVDLRDAHAYGGIALVALGCAWLTPPAGLIVAGVAFFYLAMRKG